MTKKKTNRILQIISGLLLTLTLSGCFGVNGNFIKVRNNILSNFNSSYSTTIEYGFGGVSISLAKIFISFSDVDDAGLTNDMLGEISDVQIGIYEKQNSNTRMNFKFLKQLTAKMKNNGWICFVRAAERKNLNAVLFKESRNNELHKMLVINISDNELILAEINGNLNKIIEMAIRNDGLSFGLAEN